MMERRSRYMNITGICTVLIAFAFPKEVLSQQPLKGIHNEMTAELRITQAGLALLQHKQSQDAFPETLEAHKLSATDDPFSAEPLRYKPQGQGFILYSIGPDQKDNDGSPRQKKQKDEWDIVWSYTGGR